MAAPFAADPQPERRMTTHNQYAMQDPTKQYP